ncbi:ETHYLENE INSENSITIVE 3-like 5 protein-like, partial [Trifolium medium]|nr:ETHYLENE INSENSITIVE 3-like 5 protein-like [Trifolium medium]
SSRNEKRKCVFDVGGDDAEYPQKSKLPMSLANFLDCEAKIENVDDWMKMGEIEYEGGKFGWDVEHWLNDVDDHDMEAALEMVKEANLPSSGRIAIVVKTLSQEF